MKREINKIITEITCIGYDTGNNLSLRIAVKRIRQ